MLDEQYLKDLGIADLPEEARAPLVAGLEKQVQDRISLRLAERLSDEKLDELAGVTDGEGDNTELVTKWLLENVPDYAEVVRGALGDVRAEILAARGKVIAS